MNHYIMLDEMKGFDSLLWCGIDPVGSSSNAYGSQAVQGNMDVEKAEGKDAVAGAEEGNLPPPVKEAEDKKPKNLNPPKQGADASKAGEVLNQKAVQSVENLLTQIMILMMKNNHDRRVQAAKQVWAEASVVAAKMHTQAEDSRSSAFRTMMVSACVAGVSLVAAGYSAYSAHGANKAIESAKQTVENVSNDVTKVAADIKEAKDALEVALEQGKEIRGKAEAITSLTQAAGQIATAISDYRKASTEADSKILDADMEILRAEMDTLRKIIDDARQTVQQTMSSMNEMLQTKRQTMQRIMG